ncbi:MAG: class I SAM-dependent methyltransferase [Alphaproteobacteria bacterium]|nr:MAG: class I SAM-dependent methyltransferase [Alphaproteobacteria bacterium]
MTLEFPVDIDTVKGFMPPDEGAALLEAALQEAGKGPCLEVGSYCGKSAVYLGSACKEVGSTLFTVDHHRGSEENQPGWEHHDPETWDGEAGAMDTLPFLRRTLRRAGLEGTVVPIVGASLTVARHWRTPLALLFIDGGHGMEPAMDDYRAWTPHVMPGGLLAIHDVFPNPEKGGRPPFEIYQLALVSGLFEEEAGMGSLRLLRRL